VVAQLDASLEGMSDVWQRCLSRLFEDFVPHAVGKGGLPNGKLLEDAQQLAVLKSLEGSQGFTCRVERVRKVRPRFGRGSGRGGSARFGGGSEASAIQGNMLSRKMRALSSPVWCSGSPSDRGDTDNLGTWGRGFGLDHSRRV
jgi:hypothetical protein